MTNKVLVTATNYSKLCKEAKAMLEEHGCEVVENPFGRPLTFEELKQYAPDACAVVAGVDTWDKQVFAFTPGLKVISRFGVGVDNINLADAKAAGIYVTNAPGINSNSVGDLAVGMMLDLLRGITRLNASTREGKWERYVGFDIKGKTIGLLGFGHIGRCVAKKLTGFDAKVIAYDKYPDYESAKALGVEMKKSLKEVVEQSFILSCHLPSLPETRRSMNAETFALMPKGSYFVNTSRGALVDEKALIDALKSGHLAGAGLDVFDQEPLNPDNPLLQVPGLILTPHSAAETYETYRDVGIVTAQAVIDTLDGKKPQNLVNP